jgi:hypothetical protein
MRVPAYLGPLWLRVNRPLVNRPRSRILRHPRRGEGKSLEAEGTEDADGGDAWGTKHRAAEATVTCHAGRKAEGGGGVGLAVARSSFVL